MLIRRAIEVCEIPPCRGLRLVLQLLLDLRGISACRAHVDGEGVAQPVAFIPAAWSWEELAR